MLVFVFVFVFVYVCVRAFVCNLLIKINRAN